jgi:hypothetical protein
MINGEIAFGELSMIRQSILTPNIMGFFSYIPNMECNHSILSMGHKLFGKLIINGEEVDFTNGEGYIEKDYGTSFPESYIWIQSNHFSSDSRLLFSTATIPFMGFSFQGLICNLQVNEKEYRFATYNVSRLKIIKLEENLVSLSITKGRYKLLIDAKINDGKDLKAPYKGKMNKIIKEVLGGQVKFDLYHNSKLIISDESNICGIEIVQDLHKN